MRCQVALVLNRNIDTPHIHELVQERRSSITNALNVRLFCTKLSIYRQSNHYISVYIHHSGSWKVTFLRWSYIHCSCIVHYSNVILYGGNMRSLLHVLEPSSDRRPQSMNTTPPPAIMLSVLTTGPWPIHLKQTGTRHMVSHTRHKNEPTLRIKILP